MPRPLIALFLTAAAAHAETHVVETAHYHLEYTGDANDKARADEYGRVLESAWPQFKAFLQKKPKVKKGTKLRVRYFTTRGAMVKAIRDDGGTPPDKGGGMYWPPTRTAYAFRQGTKYKSRHLLIHEAAHQYHFLSRTKNKNPAVKWWTEGVAEYLAHHHWDGQKLQLGVVPLVNLDDEPKRALDEASKPGFDLAQTVSSKEMSSYGMAWALFRFAATGNAGKPIGKFKGFAKKLDAGNQASKLYKRMIGPPKTLGPKFLAWLRANQQPWRYVHNEWQSAGPKSLRGADKKVWSIAVLKLSSKQFTATMRIAGKPKGWRGGVVLHYEDPRNFSVAALDWGGFVHIQRMIDGKWKIMERGHVPSVEGQKDPVFALFRRKNGVLMMIGNTGFGPWELPDGPFGLTVYKSDLIFTDVEAK